VNSYVRDRKKFENIVTEIVSIDSSIDREIT